MINFISMPEENMKSCCCRHHHKVWVIALAFVLVAAIVIVALLRDRIVNQPYRQVTVTGQGRVSYQPDQAIVTLGVQIDKVAKPDEALNQLNAKATSIIAAIKGAGVPAENIQTQNYSLNPQYSYPPNSAPAVSGYSANEQLVVKVTGYNQEPEKLGKVIKAASQAGANQVNNLTFEASNLNDLKQQARILAIKDAKEKSHDLIKAAGVRIRNIAGWYENYVQPQASYIDYSAKGGMGGGSYQAPMPQTPSGSQEVVIEVGVNYNIK